MVSAEADVHQGQGHRCGDQRGTAEADGGAEKAGGRAENQGLGGDGAGVNGWGLRQCYIFGETEWIAPLNAILIFILKMQF